jgi:hypothetical protein
MPSNIIRLLPPSASADLIETVDALAMAARDLRQPLLGLAYVAIYSQLEYGLGIKGAAKDSSIMRAHSMVLLLEHEIADRIRGKR